MSRIVGVFGDFVVDYKNFLTLNVKARNDWASTLTKANRSIFYPAVVPGHEYKDRNYICT